MYWVKRCAAKTGRKRTLRDQRPKNETLDDEGKRLVAQHALVRCRTPERLGEAIRRFICPALKDEAKDVVWFIFELLVTKRPSSEANKIPALLYDDDERLKRRMLLFIVEHGTPGWIEAGCRWLWCESTIGMTALLVATARTRGEAYFCSLLAGIGVCVVK